MNLKVIKMNANHSIYYQFLILIVIKAIQVKVINYVVGYMLDYLEIRINLANSKIRFDSWEITVLTNI